MSSKEQQNDLSQFGILQSNYEWVECESKSEPGKLYYFNLKTTCTTWKKPVSRYTNIPRFSLMKIPPRMPSIAESPPLIVSDEETKDEDRNIVSIDTVDKRAMMKSNVLQYLLRLDGKRDHTSYEVLTEDIPDLGDADTRCSKNQKENCLRDFVKSQIIAQTNSESSGSNRSTCSTCSSGCNESSSSNRDGMSNSSSSACPCCVPQIKQETNSEGELEYAVPRVKRIEPSDLLYKTRRRISRSAKTCLRKRRPTKIICDMYGTRTINYNFNFLENASTKSTMSDSSHSRGLSVSGQEKTLPVSKYDNDDLLNIPAPNLSEPSTCSSTI